MKFSDIIERIKVFFRNMKNPQKSLPEGSQDAQREAFLRKTKVNVVPPPKEPTLEECISEFIKIYAVNESIEPNNKDNIYMAFTRMFCIENQEEAGNNLKNQSKLSQYARDKNYGVHYQPGKDCTPFIAFYNEDEDLLSSFKNPDIEKLYLNCPRENISKITQILFDSIVKQKEADPSIRFQMKCVSEQILPDYIDAEKERQIKTYQRNDKIVIYAENHETSMKLAETINHLKGQYPDLFSKLRAVPVLPKIDGFIGVAPNSIYKPIVTPSRVITGDTYHDILSKIFAYSVVEGFDSFHGMGSYTNNTPFLDRLKQYTSEFIDDNLPQDIKHDMIKKCASSFKQICIKNEINTIYTPVKHKEQELKTR